MSSTFDAPPDAQRPASFEPVTRETLSAQIRDQLLDRILSGALEPGDRVPSERDLSEQFQVARTSVREAMQGLLSMGVIERRGNRSYVVEHLPDVTIDESADRTEFIRQLFETRRLLEVPIIELAAERASDVERREIADLGDRFTAGIDLVEFRELDRAFHTMIARACQNPLLVEVYGKVLARLFHSEEIAALLSDEANRALAAAVASGDVEAAAREGTAHLAAVERRMIDRLV
jgi:GntR family transcriptional repressor for pyruvate dehydrogenase complex